MAQVAIVGGHGKIARLLIPMLVDAGHEPVALTRDPGQADAVTALGALWREWDIETSDPGGDVDVLRGARAVVFTAGGGPDGRADRKRTVDLDGSLRSQRAARSLGIHRFVQVSAIGVDRPVDRARGPVWQAYVEAKREADRVLRESDLAWTVLRPGPLTDGPATGRVRLGEQVERAAVTRADVAAVLAAVLDDDRTVRRQWELVGGTETVPGAIERLVTGCG
jgi:uncharacterized protein YbjT (DUF2867 family)